MVTGEKNVILDILNSDDLFNRMALIGDGTTILPQTSSWGSASSGSISLSSDVEFDFVSGGDTAYGVTVYASSITLGVAASFIALTFNPSLEFDQYDIYTISGLDLTVNDN